MEFILGFASAIICFGLLRFIFSWKQIRESSKFNSETMHLMNERNQIDREKVLALERIADVIGE
jgi:hypothetical protein